MPTDVVDGFVRLDRDQKARHLGKTLGGAVRERLDAIDDNAVAVDRWMHMDETHNEQLVVRLVTKFRRDGESAMGALIRDPETFADLMVEFLLDDANWP